MKTLFIYIDLKGKKTVVLGGGRVAERRARKLLSYGAHVAAAAREFTPFFSRKLKNLSLTRLDLESDMEHLESLLQNVTLAFVATDDHALNLKLTDLVKRSKLPVNVADNPKISDFFVPAIARFGDVQVAISTGGKSPTMAQALRRRIGEVISLDDLNQVMLQYYARRITKKYIPDIDRRRRFLRQLLTSKEVTAFLETGKILDAKRFVNRLAKSWGEKRGKRCKS